ncbi:MAG: hypothetical protein ACI8X5_003049 [Planctomycetota bacterium]|jgi:hypothetical protein
MQQRSLLIAGLPALFLLVATPTAGAQGFGSTWLEFQNNNSLIVGDASVTTSDGNEKDFATGDFDQDGLDDLVVVRKQPAHTTGARTNVLFMNVGGSLVDSTAAFAASSDVGGDQGFLTATNDRDVVAVDVDNDGWIDIVTSTTLSPGQPKHISHPRVYMNLGNDGGGMWQGFQHQDARIPQLLLAGGASSWPRFTAVDAGDVTGDGFADLYFGDNQNAGGQGGGDMNDRLLVNDGSGFFVDETTARLTGAMSNTDYTTAVTIADMNGDGANDVLRQRGHGGGTSLIYNDPGMLGSFATIQSIYNGSPYYASAGDLNQDSKLDVVVSHNSVDRFKLNTGNDVNGDVIWSSSTSVTYVTGSDDSFAGDSHILDLDNDGWNDVVITDFDSEIAGCGRRTHIFHNAGGTIGGAVTLREEAEMAGSGWRGAIGLQASDLTGTHDAAFIDLDADGDMDMVLGRCAGMFVWINQTVSDPVGTIFCECAPATAPCSNFAAAGEGCLNSAGVGAVIVAGGSTSVIADDLDFAASQLAPNKPSLLFVGTTAPNGGNGLVLGDGLRCPGGAIIRLSVQFSDSNGDAAWSSGIGAAGGWAAGDTRYFQAWYRDALSGPCGSGFNLSNGLEIQFTN